GYSRANGRANHALVRVTTELPELFVDSNLLRSRARLRDRSNQRRRNSGELLGIHEERLSDDRATGGLKRSGFATARRLAHWKSRERGLIASLSRVAHIRSLNSRCLRFSLSKT